MLDTASPSSRRRGRTERAFPSRAVLSRARSLETHLHQAGLDQVDQYAIGTRPPRLGQCADTLGDTGGDRDALPDGSLCLSHNCKPGPGSPAGTGDTSCRASALSEMSRPAYPRVPATQFANQPAAGAGPVQRDAEVAAERVRRQQPIPG
jgi:hypothetical protein